MSDTSKIQQLRAWIHEKAYETTDGVDSFYASAQRDAFEEAMVFLDQINVAPPPKLGFDEILDDFVAATAAFEKMTDSEGLDGLADMLPILTDWRGRSWSDAGYFVVMDDGEDFDVDDFDRTDFDGVVIFVNYSSRSGVHALILTAGNEFRPAGEST